MNTLELKLYFLCEDDKLRRCLSKSVCLPDINCVFMAEPQDSKIVEDRWNNVIFSDSVEKLAPYFTEANEKLWIVYVGEPAKLSRIDADKFGIRFDIWPAYESDDMFRFRFKGLLGRIEEWYNARWYKKLLTTTIDSIPDLVWYKDARGAHMLVNDSFCQTVHKTKEDIFKRGHYYIWDITPEEYSSGEYVCMESEEIVMNAGKTCMFEEPVKTSAGMKHFNTYKTPVYDLDGEIWGTVGVAHDATSLSNMGLELSVLVENIPFPMVVCSADWGAVRINSYFREIFDISEDEIKDFNYQMFKHKMCIPCGEKYVNDYNRSVSQDHFIERNGEEQVFSIVEQDIQDFFGQVSGHFCLFRDVTAKRFYEKQIYEMAHTDSLTGLKNRRAFYEYVAAHSQEPICLLYMDLDNFKQVNDRFGHDRGDEVLCKTAKQISNIFPDGVAARLGGDEFALVLTGEVNERELGENIKKLENAVRGMFRGNGFYITISVGIVRCEDECDVDLIIKRADEAMYEIKEKHHRELRMI